MIFFVRYYLLKFEIVMCVDIGYKSMLGPDGLPRYIPGIKINREQVEGDKDRPHIAGHTNTNCWVLVEGGDHIFVSDFGWGITPGFKTPTPLYNARSEKILERGSFWNSLNVNRCLVIADGVYEHQQRVGVKKKVPYYIKQKSGAPFLIPAVFDENSRRFSIITRSANGVFKEIHNAGPNKHRMPLLCPMSLALEWIRKDLSDIGLLHILSFLLPDDLLSYHTVYSIRSNTERPDGLKENDFFNWSQSGRAEQSSLF